MKFDPTMFAPVEGTAYDPIMGDPQPVPANPERELLDDSYIWFASQQGRTLLDDLITRYIAAPIFDSSRDAAKGYERNGEANVVRDIITRMERAMRNREQRT